MRKKRSTSLPLTKEEKMKKRPQQIEKNSNGEKK